MFNTYMRTDIEEKEDGYVLSIEVPGASKEDIKIDVVDNSIKVGVKYNDEKASDKYINKEIFNRNVERTYHLRSLDEDSIKAKLENGILYINCLKVKVDNSKKLIEIV